jgi:hypothetical protein
LVLAVVHHLGLALFGILIGIGSAWSMSNLSSFQELQIDILVRSLSWDYILTIQLGLLGFCSIIYGHLSYSFQIYPYLAVDHSSMLSLFVHHAWIGSFLHVGCLAHLAILTVRREGIDSLTKDLVYHRDMITGHLVWVVTFLGMHSFGLYVHNDSLLALISLATHSLTSL